MSYKKWYDPEHPQFVSGFATAVCLGLLVVLTASRAAHWLTQNYVIRSDPTGIVFTPIVKGVP